MGNELICLLFLRSHKPKSKCTQDISHMASKEQFDPKDEGGQKSRETVPLRRFLNEFQISNIAEVF